MVGASLVVVSACEGWCGKDEQVGGGSAGLEVAAHVRVTQPAALWGSPEVAREELGALFGVEPHIARESDPARPIDVLIGVGRAGVETHVTWVAPSDARERLVQRYALEPMMFRQERIKPAEGRARCMLFDARIACAVGEARIGRGVLAVERLATQTRGVTDAASGAEPLAVVAVPAVERFTERVLPVLRQRVERGLTRGQAAAALREPVLGALEDVASEAAQQPVLAWVRGEQVVIELTVSTAVPSGWRTPAPRPHRLEGWVALGWRQGANAESPAPLAAGLGTGRGLALRVRDGARVELFELEDRVAAAAALSELSPSSTGLRLAETVVIQTAPDTLEEAGAFALHDARGEAVARAVIDLAMFGAEGSVELAAFPLGGGKLRLELAMEHTAFASLMRWVAGVWAAGPSR